MIYLYFPESSVGNCRLRICLNPVCSAFLTINFNGIPIEKIKSQHGSGQNHAAYQPDPFRNTDQNNGKSTQHKYIRADHNCSYDDIDTVHRITLYRHDCLHCIFSIVTFQIFFHKYFIQLRRNFLCALIQKMCWSPASVEIKKNLQ